MVTKPLLLWKSNKYYIFLCGVCPRAWVNACVLVQGADACFGACGPTYTICKDHPPYRLRPLWLYHIFRYFVINGTVFGKTLLNIKRVLIPTIIFIWNISRSKKFLARYCHKYENVMLDRFLEKTSNALLVGRSQDRSPVVSLGIFSEANDGTMCPGVDSASKYEYQENSWG